MYTIQKDTIHNVRSTLCIRQANVECKSSSDRHEGAETRMGVPVGNARAILKRWRIPVPVQH